MSSKFLGIDLGYHSIVSASSDTTDPFVVTVDANGLSNRSTPSIIGIENNRVLFGEEAETRITSVPQKMISSIPHVIQAGKLHGPFDLSSESIHLDSCHLLSLFFKNFVEQVHGPNVSLQHVTISVPVQFTFEQKQLVVDAALLTGLEGKFSIIDHLDAAMTLMYRDLSAAAAAATTGYKTVIVVDCGFRETGVGIMSDGEIVCKKSIAFGVVDMVHAIGTILFPGKKIFDFLFTSDKKLYFRLFKVCEKILKDLSMLPTTVVDLGDYEEALDRNGIKLARRDFAKSVNRDQLESVLIELGFSQKLSSVIKATIDGVYSPPTRPRVEIVGGGSRVPFIAKLVSETTGVDQLGRSMDGTAFAALGSALWSAGLHVKGGVMTLDDSKPDRNRLIELEVLQSRIESVHKEEVARLAKKNDLESFLFQVKYWLDEDERTGKNLLPRQQIQAELDSLWLWFEDNVESGSGEEFEFKNETLKNFVQEEGKEFFANLESDKIKTEKSLSANAEYLSSHSANETSAEKREKHSSALGKDQAMKLAARNKDEGNDLFKHGTVTDAMNRYLRAIGILAQIKKNECTMDEKSYVDSIGLACNLNIAQCVVRMTADPASLTQEERYGLLKRGIASADSALAIDPSSSKAKYRKAVCLERMKETEKAKQVIDEAMRENPDDDDLKKLYDSLMASLKEQQSKAKKFFSKMFQ